MCATKSEDVAAKALKQFEASATPMWIFDIHSLAFLAVNDAAIRRYGFSREEFLSKTILDIRPAEDIVPLIREELKEQKHDSDNELWRHRSSDGRVFAVRITSRKIAFRGRLAEIVMAQEVEG